MTDRQRPLVGLKRHLRALAVPGDAVYLLSEEDTIALRGANVESVIALLDGSMDLEDVRRRLPSDVEPGQVADLLGRLAEAGLVSLRADVDADPATLAYWDASGAESEQAVERIAAASVAVITVGVDPEPAVAALRAAGLDARTGTGIADLSVVLCHDYLADGLAEIDAAHRASGLPWLLARTTGTRIWLGPFFTPGDGACWHCLAVRLWENRPAEAHVRTALGLPGAVPRPVATTVPLTAMALNLVALEASKWLVGTRHPGQRAVWTFDSRDLQGRHHDVRARPQCASCGDESMMKAQANRPVALRSRAKTAGAGHRAVPPAQVLDDYRHLISPVTGVVREIRRAEAGPAFLNSFRSGPNLALGERGARNLRSALRAENGGKGVTVLDAEVSALCEAVERYSGCFRGDEERIRGSFRELGERAVHPDGCLLFDPRQVADRDRWNAEHADFQYVCAAFDDDEVIDWTPVWSLTRQRHRLLPTGLLYYGAPAGPALAADSNGGAAGSCLEEAVLQGMLEVVERDAVALWWYNRTRQPAVDLAAFNDPWIGEMQTVYSGLQREMWVLDVSSDIGLPVLAAVSRGLGPREDIVFGFGADLDPRVALRRALTEMNQMLPTVLGDGGYVGDDPDATAWWSTATVRNQPYFVADPALPARGPADYGYVASTDLLDDVAAVRERLEQAGLEVLVLDQTRPDIGLSVVKVIVPGTRGFWRRLAPGRLFDVPVRLGRLTEPTPYDRINPMPIFM